MVAIHTKVKILEGGHHLIVGSEGTIIQSPVNDNDRVYIIEGENKLTGNKIKQYVLKEEFLILRVPSSLEIIELEQQERMRILKKWNKLLNDTKNGK